jgi:cytochrome c oxidase subunit IV
MDAHAGHGSAHADDHSHPTPWLYLKIALVLFALTALEVLAYEVARRPGAFLHNVVGPTVVPILVVLSAAKFALVAMFYMHLRQDSKVFTNLFVFPLMIAAVVIISLIILIRYWFIATY